ncbi:unnamed protein product [Cryptosporidium hominis]|uniref:Uncharacterized protein n=1 Tax=Cryptosporidium hominis TaxID=237895 RepID=A0A0S4TBM0_CRYHO|nr:hypothetical protein [Cryptosporidium hominis TU502]PPS97232.1 Uncharacterized protein GY17_00001121 [Cryptosporidium hominis]CUV04059.1 unnamed protein product [Cryptosporidium hominis]|eukprot:PPS97232.1 Uncharacterized protein GY17_00001121 [Cryptosporidium hominis]
MRIIFLAFLVVIFFFIVKTSKGEENEKLIKISRRFLVEICKSFQISKNPEDLVNCYESSIYFCEYLWVIAYIIEEKKSFKTQMILPKGVIDNKNCMEINFQQCITIANFLINESSISVEYNAINSMVSPVIEECNFENTNLLLSLNALWLRNSNKISDLTQGVIIGRGYQELVQFTNPFLDLSTIICQDVKMYLFTEKYKMKLKAVMKDLIQYKNLPLTIPDPVYVRLPLKYDEELDLNWLYCQDLPKYLNKLDEISDQIKLDLRGKSLIINKDIITKCTLKNNNKVMKIITWKIVN